ncbi:MAG: PEP-CTERM sorting domain-containing protein [Gammaproteobacteria bacterium]|nr:PEP-CTERM sorting domain-containing protein [Gammaproteobacteria bacterium]
MKPTIKSSILAAALALGAGPAGAIVADGKLDAGMYQRVFEVVWDVTALSGPGSNPTQSMVGDTIKGVIAFGEMGGKQYFYYALPKEFNDNSYGANVIGWEATKHNFDKLSGSDDHQFIFDTTGGTLDVTLDYIATAPNKDATQATEIASAGINQDTNISGTPENDERGAFATVNQKLDGSLNSGDKSVIEEIATSLEWNIQNIGSFNDDGNPANRTGGHTYDTDSPTADLDYSNPSEADWLYEMGYEVEFAGGTFLNWLDADPSVVVIDGQTDDNNLVLLDITIGNVTIGSLHASPHKLDMNFSGIVCSDLSSTACDGQPPSTGVPEPGSLSLFGIGIAGAALLRRRTKRRCRS